MNSLHSRTIRMSFSALEASVAAGVTIAARAPILLSHFTGRPERSEESVRMVAEKIEAAVEGAAAAQVALWSLWGQVAFGMVRGPTAFAHGMADVADAAMRPAHRRVRANARRLVER
jgi:dihydropteroate synthase